MIGIDADEPNKVLLLMGNEAIARGVLEAGVGVATAYPVPHHQRLLIDLQK